MIFFSRKPKPTSLPPDWPSPYHNKCSQPDCLFPNNPQATKGSYPCRGVPGGFYCEGTYKISSSRAHDTERYLKELTAARRHAHVHVLSPQQQQHHHQQAPAHYNSATTNDPRKRTVSEMRRPALAPGDPNVRRRTREPGYVPSDDRRAAYPSRALPVSRPSRQSDASRPAPQLPLRRPSYGGYRPSNDQVQAEYITDQIMMHLYPERKIQPRW